MNIFTEDPVDVIAGFANARRSRTDEELLDELASLRPLPPDVADNYDLEESWRQAYLLVALSDLIAERKLKSGVPLILERMCFGDPGEIMRGVRHALEEAADGDWLWLAKACEEATRSPLPGSRLWAVDELSVLRESRSVPRLIELLADDTPEIVEGAARALSLIAKDHGDLRDNIRRSLRTAISNRPHIAAAITQELNAVESLKS